MRKYILMAGLIGAATFGMDRPSMADAGQKLSISQIQEAYLKIAHTRTVTLNEHKKVLSDQLFLLSVNWSDRFGIVGLTLGRTLLEKGADPYYPQVEQQLLENKKKTMMVVYTQTAFRVAHGKLQSLLKSYLPEQVDE